MISASDCLHSYQIEDSYPVILNCAPSWKHDFINCNGWMDAWISWNVVNMTSCSLSCSNVDWSPLAFRSSAFNQSDVHFPTPALSSPLSEGTLQACARVTSSTPESSRDAFCGVRFYIVVLFSNFLYHRHTQGCDSYVRAAASSANRPGKGINTSKRGGIGWGGWARIEKHEVMLEMIVYTKNNRVHLGWHMTCEACVLRTCLKTMTLCELISLPVSFECQKIYN